MRYVALIGFLFVLAGCQIKSYQNYLNQASEYKAWAIAVDDGFNAQGLQWAAQQLIYVDNQPSQKEADNKALKFCRDIYSQHPEPLDCILYAQGNEIVWKKEFKSYQIQKARETCMQIGFKENDNAFNNCILEIISAKALADENINLQNQINALQNQLMFK